MKNLKDLRVETEKYVTRLLTENLPDGLFYHDISHTRRVAEQADMIGRHENLSTDELDIVVIAAWFHDVGYIQKYEGHEEVSISIATEFLRDQGLDADLIKTITECISATRIPHDPKNKLEAVLCDADMMHMGLESYPDIIKNLRKEWNYLGFKTHSKNKFRKESIRVMQEHQFYTDYCRNELSGIKEKNLTALKSAIQKTEQETKIVLPQKNAAGKIKTYSRGADSMLRLTARNQINLSSIADKKSNILISINGIIISLGLAFMVGNFGERPGFILPVLLFLGFSLATIILAILSTRPNISKGRPNEKQTNSNLLFFGNFYKMDPDDYERSINELINDDPSLYSAMIRDQYHLGKVLARKYKLLSISYGVFMAGLIISVISFILVYLPL